MAQIYVVCALLIGCDYCYTDMWLLTELMELKKIGHAHETMMKKLKTMLW